MTSTSATTREIDLDAGNTIAVSIQQDLLGGGYILQVALNPHNFPAHVGDLTPAAARALAAHLTELADEADVRNA